MLGDYTLAQLSGCTEAVLFSTHMEAREAIRQLCSCNAHRGIHHFAVVNEGLTVVMSKTGVECLERAGVV
jgi:hypothetical protein